MNLLSIFKFPNYLKRNFLILIDKDYVNKKLKKRKGNCKKCGECCKGCRYLDKETRLCKIYNKRPFLCYKDFPLDRLDQRIWNVKKCGYEFD